MGLEVTPERALAGEEASVKELARSILATPTGRVGCFSPNLFRAPAMASGAHIPAAAIAAAKGPLAAGCEAASPPCSKAAAGSGEQKQAARMTSMAKASCMKHGCLEADADRQALLYI